MSTASDIVDTVKSRLETITVDGGFNTDAGLNVITGRKQPDETEVPVICVFDTTDQPDDAQKYMPTMWVTLTIVAEAYISVGDNPQTSVHSILSDIKTAVLLVDDRTLAGQTLDFGYAGREIVWPDDPGGLIAVRVSFESLYSETYGAP